MPSSSRSRRTSEPERRLAPALLLLLIAPLAAAAQEEPPPMPEEVYLTLPQALRKVLPEEDAPSLERADVALTGAERGRIERRLGSRVLEEGFSIFRGLARDGSVEGYAVVTEEIGKYKPITFAVAVAPDATVKDVAVMVYRESHGAEVRRRRFLAQFLGKGRGDPIRQNRDILNISGATLSVRSVTRGVRKVLFVVDEVLLGPARRAGVVWAPAGLAGDGAPGGARETGMAPLRDARWRMGTVLEATVYPEEGAARAGAARALDRAFAEVARLERLMTTFDPASELSRVNREAARGPVAVSPETFECVAAAVGFAERSGGAFDPTLRPGGFARVRIDRAARTIAFLPGDGAIALDLGGIAKGYALDRAAAVLRAGGVRRALLDFGGQILALEPPPGERAWVVAVEDPRSRASAGGGAAGPAAGAEVEAEACDRALGFFEVANASVATSSQAERPGHIVDPRTGRPAAGALSASVRAPSALAADALATAALVLGPERGRALVATEPGAEALIAGP